MKINNVMLYFVIFFIAQFLWIISHVRLWCCWHFYIRSYKHFVCLYLSLNIPLIIINDAIKKAFASPFSLFFHFNTIIPLFFICSTSTNNVILSFQIAACTMHIRVVSFWFNYSKMNKMCTKKLKKKTLFPI